MASFVERPALVRDTSNGSKRALMMPKGWSLETAEQVLTSVTAETSLDLFDQLSKEAAPLVQRTMRQRWDNKCSEWELYRACMISYLTRGMVEHGARFVQEIFIPTVRSSKGRLFEQVVLNEERIFEASEDEYYYESGCILDCVNIVEKLDLIVSRNKVGNRSRKRLRPDNHNNWKIPLVYEMIHIVVVTSSQEEMASIDLNAKMNAPITISWDTIRQKLQSSMSESFGNVIGNTAIVAGLALYALTAMNDSNDGEVSVKVWTGQEVQLEGLTCEHVVGLLLTERVLTLIQTLTNIPMYPLVEKFVQILLNHSSSSPENENGPYFAKRLLEVGSLRSATTYLDDLCKPQTGPKPPPTNQLQLESSSLSDMKRQMLEPSFPLLVEIELDLCTRAILQAISIASRMESCGNLSNDAQTRAWWLVLEYLRCESLLFLDGNFTRSSAYKKKRNLLLSVSSSIGNLGRNVLLDYMQTVVKLVSGSDRADAQEVQYVTLAAQQTVLRLLACKYNIELGVKFLSETFPSVGIMGVANIKQWYIRFLTRPPSVPPSMIRNGQVYLRDLMDRVSADQAEELFADDAGTIVAPTPPTPRVHATSSEILAPAPRKPVRVDNEQEKVIELVDSEEEELGSYHRVEARKRDDETAEPHEVMELFEGIVEQKEQMESVHEEHLDDDREAEEYGEQTDDDFEEELVRIESKRPRKEIVIEDDTESEEVVHEEDYVDEEHAAVELEDSEEQDSVVVDDDDDDDGTDRVIEGCLESDEDQGYEPGIGPHIRPEGNTSERIGDDKGYEPDTGAYGYTEEEVSEALHSEEEDDDDPDEPGSEVDELPHTSSNGPHGLSMRAPYSENDMDEADELTASELEVHDEESALGDQQATNTLLTLSSMANDGVGVRPIQVPPPQEESPVIAISVPGMDTGPIDQLQEDSVVSGNGSAGHRYADPVEKDRAGEQTMPPPPIVNRVPTSHETMPLDDNTNAATAPSDVDRYLSECADEASLKNVQENDVAVVPGVSSIPPPKEALPVDDKTSVSSAPSNEDLNLSKDTEATSFKDARDTIASNSLIQRESPPVDDSAAADHYLNESLENKEGIGLRENSTRDEVAVVSSVPSQHEAPPVDDNTNAATAPSDVDRYLSEYTEDASWKNGEETASTTAVLEDDELGSLLGGSPSTKRASILVHGCDSPKEALSEENEDVEHKAQIVVEKAVDERGRGHADSDAMGEPSLGERLPMVTKDVPEAGNVRIDSEGRESEEDRNALGEPSLDEPLPMVTKDVPGAGNEPTDNEGRELEEAIDHSKVGSKKHSEEVLPVDEEDASSLETTNATMDQNEPIATKEALNLVQDAGLPREAFSENEEGMKKATPFVAHSAHENAVEKPSRDKCVVQTEVEVVLEPDNVELPPKVAVDEEIYSEEKGKEMKGGADRASMESQSEEVLPEDEEDASAPEIEQSSLHQDNVFTPPAEIIKNINEESAAVGKGRISTESNENEVSTQDFRKENVVEKDEVEHNVARMASPSSEPEEKAGGPLQVEQDHTSKDEDSFTSEEVETSEDEPSGEQVQVPSPEQVARLSVKCVRRSGTTPAPSAALREERIRPEATDITIDIETDEFHKSKQMNAFDEEERRSNLEITSPRWENDQDSIAMHTRSHDKSLKRNEQNDEQASEEEEEEERPWTLQAVSSLAVEFEGEESVALHTRSHDKSQPVEDDCAESSEVVSHQTGSRHQSEEEENTLDSTPEMAATAFASAEAPGESLHGKSIEIGPPDSPGVSSISASIAPRRRRRTRGAGEKALSPVDEEPQNIGDEDSQPRRSHRTRRKIVAGERGANSETTAKSRRSQRVAAKTAEKLALELKTTETESEEDEESLEEASVDDSEDQMSSEEASLKSLRRSPRRGRKPEKRDSKDGSTTSGEKRTLRKRKTKGNATTTEDGSGDTQTRKSGRSKRASQTRDNLPTVATKAPPQKRRTRRATAAKEGDDGDGVSRESTVSRRSNRSRRPDALNKNGGDHGSTVDNRETAASPEKRRTRSAVKKDIPKKSTEVGAGTGIKTRSRTKGEKQQGEDEGGDGASEPKRTRRRAAKGKGDGGDKIAVSGRRKTRTASKTGAEASSISTRANSRRSTRSSTIKYTS